MKLFKNLCFAILMISIASCGGGGGGTGGDSGDDTTTGNVTSDLFGKWVYVDTTEEIELLSTTTLPTYEKLSSNVLKVGSRHLLRASVTNTPISGKVLGDTTKTKSGQKAFTGIGGIDVILENVSDPSVKTSTKTDADGNFVDSSLPSGVYTIIGDDGNGGTFTSSVTINGTSTNLGNFSIDNNGYNFKTELILNQFFAYGDGTTYTGVVRVHNTGINEGTGLAYDVTMSDYYLKDFTADITLGTVPAGTYKDIPVSFSFNELNVAKRTVTINTNIRDVNGNSWADDFEFTIYRRSMPINLTADSATVKGYVVIAGNLLIPFDTTNTTINIPVDPETPAYVMMANADIETETVYSIGIDTPAISTAGFNNPPVFEPNNNETEATSLALGGAEVAYLHKGDLDYYLIDQSAENTTLEQFSIPTTTDAPLSTGNAGVTVDLGNYLYEGESTVVTSTSGTLYRNGVVVPSGTAFDATDTLSLTLDTLNCSQEATTVLNIAGVNYEYTVQSRPCQLISAEDYIVELLANESSSITLDFEESAVVNLVPRRDVPYVTTTGNTVSINPSYEDAGAESLMFDVHMTGTKITDTNIVIRLELNVLRSRLDTNVSNAGSPITMQIATPTADANVIGQLSTKLISIDKPIGLTNTASNWNSGIYVNNRIYVFRGDSVVSDGEGGYISSKYPGEYYDIATEVWKEISPPPFSLSVGFSNLVVDGGLVYGTSNDGTGIGVIAYDTRNDTWQRFVPEQGAPSVVLSMHLYKGKIYAVSYNTTNNPTIEMYDPKSNRWTRLLDGLSTTPQSSSVLLNGKIYSFSSGWEVYDIDTNSVAVGARLNCQSAKVVEEKIYCDDRSLNIDTREYDPANDIFANITDLDWSYTTIPENFRLAAVDGVLFLLFNTKASDSTFTGFYSADLLPNLTWNSNPPIGNYSYRVRPLVVESPEQLFFVGGWRLDLSTSFTVSTAYVRSAYDYSATISSSTKISDGLYEIQFTDIDSTVDRLSYTIDGVKSHDSHAIESN